MPKKNTVEELKAKRDKAHGQERRYQGYREGDFNKPMSPWQDEQQKKRANEVKGYQEQLNKRDDYKPSVNSEALYKAKKGPKM